MANEPYNDSTMPRMSLTDARAILGVEGGTDEKEIKTRFRALAIQNHPDHGGDAETFKRIAEAYSTIMNWGKSDIVASGIESDIFDSMWDDWFRKLSPEDQNKIAEELNGLEREE